MDELAQRIIAEIEESIAVKTELGRQAMGQIAQAATVIVKCLQNGGKLIVFGNGGSAADAQHIAAEFVGRYRADRKALAAIALTTDSSALTAIGNDYGFDQIFVRQLGAIGRAGGRCTSYLYEREFTQCAARNRVRKTERIKHDRPHGKGRRKIARFSGRLFVRTVRSDFKRGTS